MITGQRIYLGPNIMSIGLKYGQGFTDQGPDKSSIFPHYEQFIKDCPAIGELFVLTHEVAKVRRQLNFDYGRQMRGTTGKYVAFYNEVQNWLAKRAKSTKTPSTEGVKVTTHA